MSGIVPKKTVSHTELEDASKTQPPKQVSFLSRIWKAFTKYSGIDFLCTKISNVWKRLHGSKVSPQTKLDPNSFMEGSNTPHQKQPLQ